MIQYSSEDLQCRREVVAIADPFIRYDRIIHIFPFDDRSIISKCIFGPLHPKGNEDGNIPKVGQVMIDWRYAQRSHGGDEHRAMEGTDVYDRGGQDTEIIHDMEGADGKLLNQSWNVIQ